MDLKAEYFPAPYAPTIENLKSAYVEWRRGRSGMTVSRAQAEEEFSDALAKHDQATAVEALEDAATELNAVLVQRISDVPAIAT